MKIENIKLALPFDKIKTKNLVSNETGDLILINIEKGMELKEHSSPSDASILILKGKVNFKIYGIDHFMKKGDLFNFEKNEVHAIEALKNSSILLIK